MLSQITIAEATNLCLKALVTNGLNESDAHIITEHLIDNETAGFSSHGLYRVPRIVNSIKQSDTPTEIIFEVETNNSILLNGGNRQGLVVALKGAEVAVAKAKSANVGVVGGYRYVGTTGVMGYFTRQIANAGLIGIMLANSEASIPAWGGTQPLFGTNPISISIPSKDKPIVVDLATSQWTYGDLAIAMKEGRRIPEGIVLGKDGIRLLIQMTLIQEVCFHLAVTKATL